MPTMPISVCDGRFPSCKASWRQLWCASVLEYRLCYSNTGKLNNSETGSSTTYENTYYGTGGLHQVYLGFGWMPFKGLAIGVNGSYLWGNYTRSVINSYSDSYVNTLSKYYTADVNSYKLDFGPQYTLKLSKKDNLTIGLTYGLGHKLGADPNVR